MLLDFFGKVRWRISKWLRVVFSTILTKKILSNIYMGKTVQESCLAHLKKIVMHEISSYDHGRHDTKWCCAIEPSFVVHYNQHENALLLNGVFHEHSCDNCDMMHKRHVVMSSFCTPLMAGCCYSQARVLTNSLPFILKKISL